MINQSYNLPCGAQLRNRIAKAAMTERLAYADRLPNERHYALYDHWSQNGAGLLISGNIVVDKRYVESNGNVVIEKDTPANPFKKWTSIVAQRDQHFWAQLNHAGRQTSVFATRKPVSASDVQLKKMGLFARPKALSQEGILDVINRFTFAAEFCKECGFSGVQIHGAHGYLISQFLSPKTNKRDDKWGGSIENRARLLFQIVEKCRKVVGSEFPISVKLNSADFQRGGFDEEDSKYVIKELEKRGVDLLEISGGTYEKSAMMGVGLKESTRSREVYFLDFAKELRKECSIPLMVTGGFRTLSVCEEALNNRELDVLGFGRPFLIEQDFPKGFLNKSYTQVINPKVAVLDKNNEDAAEISFYDLQIKRLVNGKKLTSNYSSLRLALHIAKIEAQMGLRNWLSK